MMGQESLFTLGPSNAVVRMLGASGPRVHTYQLDSKKELEKSLKVRGLSGERERRRPGAYRVELAGSYPP